MPGGATGLDIENCTPIVILNDLSCENPIAQSDRSPKLFEKKVRDEKIKNRHPELFSKRLAVLPGLLVAVYSSTTRYVEALRGAQGRRH